MEFLQQTWLQTKGFMAQLSPATRWLIGCLLIIFVLVGWLMMQYVAKPELVPITQFAAERQASVMAQLQQSGIHVQTQAGQLLVPKGAYDQAMMVLATSDLLAADTSGAFDDLIARQNPWQSNAQNAQAFMLAKQKVLGQIVSKMVGVRSASVILSMPDQQGFGATHVRPSASVNVVMTGSKPVGKPLVEAVAGFVAGAVAEMQAQDVVVIDANRGRQFTVKSETDMLPGETLELVQQLEQRYREKVMDILGYIPGVIVAVNVQIDPVHKKQIEEFSYEQSEPLKSEFNRETDRRDLSNAGEPGARPNTGLDIAGGSGTTSLEKVTENRNEYNDKNLTRRTQRTEVGHMTKRVNVTVNVPRSYFVGAYMQGGSGGSGGSEDQAQPTAQQLQAVVDDQLRQIVEQVEPIVSIDGGTSTVRSHMIPDRNHLLAIAGVGASQRAQTPVTMVLESTWIKPVGLGFLALLSLGIMFGMVRKATQQPVLPSIEELAGIPPTLPNEEDLVGQAEESEPAMAGMELDEESLRSRKMAEQISEMVTNNPAEALSLVNRWIHSED